MSSDEEGYGSVNPAAHKKLLSEINEIVKFQHIKKPTRSEPAVKVSEFNLVKTKPSNEDEDSVKHKKQSVSISSIATTVRKNTKQKQIGNQLKNAFKQTNVLAKPLEKVFADRIQRTIAYDNTCSKLGRWDAVVTKNQNAPQLKFPLVLEKTKFKKQGEDPDVPQFRYKTKMMKEMEEIRDECFPKPVREKQPEVEPELLSLEEMRERRKELGRLKLKESHQIAKKRMQGKIKSKKYHKLKKREELKKKMKDFEELKVSNPEAALKELQKIDRQRVQERTTLRHKNTGTWAKNLQVRAKYDDNVKQDLETQLALGRELTQKNNQSESSDSEDEETVTIVKGSNNPWLESKTSEDPLDEVFSGYKKFWEEHNSNQAKVTKIKKDLKKPVAFVEEEIEEDEPVASNSDIEEDNASDESESGEEDSEPEDESESDAQSESDNEDSSKFINDLFDEAEEKITTKMEKKLKSLKPTLLEGKRDKKKGKNSKTAKRKANVSDASYLAFKKKAKLGDVDEALMEGDASEEEDNRTPSKSILKELEIKKEQQKTFMKGSDDINPESFLNVKSKHLIMAIPKSQEFDDIDDDDVNQLTNANKMSLAEAFENDDIVNDFEQEVEEEEKKKSEIVTTVLPGWGNWGGHGVKGRAPKFMKKIPDVKKKDRVIVRTTPNEKLQKHLISSVPFPFKSVHDFEASMRLPIGRDFIPETAHRKLTAASVVTKVGTVIEPMSEDILVQNEPMKKENNKNKFMKRGKKVKRMKK